MNKIASIIYDFMVGCLALALITSLIFCIGSFVYVHPITFVMVIGIVISYFVGRKLTKAMTNYINKKS